MLWKAHLNWEAPHVFGPQARPSGFCLHSSVRRTETRVSSSGCPYRRRKQACSPSFVSWSSLKRRLLGIAWPTLRVVTAVLTIRIACPADCVGLVSGVRPKGERTSALLASKEDYRETWPLALMLVLPEGLLFFSVRSICALVCATEAIADQVTLGGCEARVPDGPIPWIRCRLAQHL